MHGGIAHGARVGIILLVGTGMSHIATARDIHVCSTCAHTSIQSAVDDAAATGDVIDIGAGRYAGNVLASVAEYRCVRERTCICSIV
jgi:hypothetical protein